MKAFVSEYSTRAANTEDLKASFERTIPPWMNLTGNGKLPSPARKLLINYNADILSD